LVKVIWLSSSKINWWNWMGSDRMLYYLTFCCENNWNMTIFSLQKVTKIFFCVCWSKLCHVLEDCYLNTPHHHNVGSHTLHTKNWESQRSSVSHCPDLSKTNSVWHPTSFFKIHFNIFSHLQVGLPSGFYHKTTPTHFSTNAFHSVCHVCVSISSTSHFKEYFTCTVSSFVQYRFLQIFTCTVTSHRGIRWCSWLRHCATSRKVAGLIPDGVTGIFHWHNPSGQIMALGLTQPLIEMSTRNNSWGVNEAGA
jgi:hypothetical protein